MKFEEYSKKLLSQFETAYGIAKDARKRNLDPESEPEIIPAPDVAMRVEGIVGPKGVAQRMKEMTAKNSTELAFKIAEDIVVGKLKDETKKDYERVEQAVRTGLSIITEGVVAAALEGISKVCEEKNADGSKYISMYFSGPIRSAGGTASAQSVLIADYVRQKVGFDRFKPTEDEVERYLEEIYLYERVKRLQYKPTPDEIKAIVRNCPICITGDPTEDEEVSVHRDLPRMGGNRLRGGMALVIGEGIAQKAAKVLKNAKEFNMDWEWISGSIKAEKKGGKIEVKKNDKFLSDLVAGRPIFAYPSTPGAFRLRYGRCRTIGIAAKAIHPAVMTLLQDFSAVGTQFKIERPGKACISMPCDSIEPPVVKLKNGNVLKVRDREEAEKILPEVEKILFLGDMLVTYGDFHKANHPLVPAGYCEEWWIKEIEAAKDVAPVDMNKIKSKMNNISAKDAIGLSKTLGVPLHPAYTYFWDDLTVDELKELVEWIANAKLSYEWFDFKGIKINADKKEILEKLCIPHNLENGEVIIDGNNGLALLTTLGVLNNKSVSIEKSLKKILESENKKIIDVLNEISEVKVRKKGGTYIGARMARPEKAKERKMKPPVHVLFPIGETGGKVRSLLKSYEKAREKSQMNGENALTVEVARMECPKCHMVNVTNKCIACGEKTVHKYTCKKCNLVQENTICEKCGEKTEAAENRGVDLVFLFENALSKVGNRKPHEIKAVKGMTSIAKIPEPIEKGILRSLNDVYVFKDGTIRFDAILAVMTHFRPQEIGTSIAKLKELGYEKDAKGNELQKGEQIAEMYVQDMVLPNAAGDYLVKVAKFIDDLLVYAYGLEPFYKAEKKEDLIGQQIIHLAPHTSAGVLGRIIGYTPAKVIYAHPYMGCATRRNADGDENCVILLLDGLLNFSRKFCPESKGGRMDAPLVMTTILDPKEIDDEVHSMEIVWDLPLEFYEAAEKITMPSDFKLFRVKDIVGKPEQYENMGYTHEITDINDAPYTSRYVTLKTMEEKVDVQFKLMSKIRAVDVQDGAEKVILSHFIPDLYGNLRKFSRQSFRCVDCNRSYRRVPLLGKCTKCGGKLLLTINKGGIEKYLDVSDKVINEYNLPNYLKQRMVLLRKEIDSVFAGEEEKKQFRINDFM